MNNNRPNTHFPQVNTVNCIILQSRNSLKYFPSHFPIYFINSKRRFFVYFKNRRHMFETIKILNDMRVKYQKRQSLIPDRQQYEQQVFHCNYKFKKIDLRRNLNFNTPYNEPKINFDIFQRRKSYFEQQKRQQNKNIERMMDQNVHVNDDKPKEKIEKIVHNERKFKNPEIKNILQNKQLLKQILFSLNKKC